MYDNLPLPDEIRARMRDLTADNEKLSENLEKQRQRHETLLNQHDLLENKVGEMGIEIQDITLQLQQKTEDLQEKSKLASSLTSRLGAATQEVSITDLKSDHKSVYEPNLITLHSPCTTFLLSTCVR